MYRLLIEGKDDCWDDARQEFFSIKGCDVMLEHSLVSISKWEAKYHKAFLKSERTVEETLDYIRMMVVGKGFEDENTIYLLSEKQIKEIDEYINDPMTATVFSKEDEKELTKDSNRDKFVSSEEIYYWMTAQNIPIECQYWHLNRLITLVKICAIKNKPDDKKKKRMTSSDLAARKARMKAARAKYHKP